MGQTLDGRYRLDGPLGAGAMGEVYRGTQVSLMRPVAVKVLPKRLIAHQDVVQRFEREAQLLSRLNHPGIVSVIDCGWWLGRPYLVMELVDGQTLEQVLGEDGRLPPERVARVMIELCMALDHAHAMGVLHRDLKPSNILVDDTRVRVVDFGVARALEQGNANITGEGMVLGTPKYCSPEQAMGMPLDGRSDLYALGIVAWRMLAGRVPFDGDGPAAIFSRHVLEVPTPIAEAAGLPREWRALGVVIDRLLAKSPGDRYAGALESAQALEAALEAAVGAGASSPETAPRATVPVGSAIVDSASLLMSPEPDVARALQARGAVALHHASDVAQLAHNLSQVFSEDADWARSADAEAHSALAGPAGVPDARPSAAGAGGAVPTTRVDRPGAREDVAPDPLDVPATRLRVGGAAEALVEREAFAPTRLSVDPSASRDEPRRSGHDELGFAPTRIGPETTRPLDDVAQRAREAGAARSGGSADPAKSGGAARSGGSADPAKSGGAARSGGSADPAKSGGAARSGGSTTRAAEPEAPETILDLAPPPHVRDDDPHDTLLDDIARPHDTLEDSGFGPTARTAAPAAATPAAPRSWIDRHPGVAAAAVIGLIVLVAVLVSHYSTPAPPPRGRAPLPPQAVEARARIARGDAAGAVEQLEEAVAKLPKDGALRVALAHAYVRAARPTDAVPHYVWAAKQAAAAFDDEHIADLAQLASSAAGLDRLELARARERLGEPAEVLTAARELLEGSACDDKRAAIKVLRERARADAARLLEPVAQGKACGAAEAKKALEALSDTPP
jgi:serine/threonine-protein kinase